MAVNYDRKIMYEYVGYLDLDGMDKEQSLKALENFWKQYPQEGVILDLGYTNGERNGYYTAFVPRLEYDKEYEIRIKGEEDWEKESKVRQRQEYLRLKQIFESQE